jgi:hypothetical protein
LCAFLQLHEKWENPRNFENVHCSLYFLLKVFCADFLHCCKIHGWLHFRFIRIFFASKPRFHFFQK